MKNNFKIGTDIIEVHRINKLIENYNYNFFNKIFTEREVKWCLSKKYPQIHYRILLILNNHYKLDHYNSLLS